MEERKDGNGEGFEEMHLGAPQGKSSRTPP